VSHDGALDSKILAGTFHGHGALYKWMFSSDTQEFQIVKKPSDVPHDLYNGKSSLFASFSSCFDFTVCTCIYLCPRYINSEMLA